MKVVHTITNKEIAGEGNHKFLLSNKKGSYALLGEVTSDFDGYFTYDINQQSLFKIISSFSLNKQPDTIINGLTWVERKSSSTTERFTITSNALIIDVEDYEGEATITLDAKRLYDESTQGRIYSCSQEASEDSQTANVHYTKYADDSRQKKVYERFIAIIVQGADILPANKQATFSAQESNDCGVWREQRVSQDEQRGMPGVRWVYDALTLRIKKNARIIITSSSQYDKLQEKKDYVQTHQESIILANNLYPKQRFANKEVLSSIAEHALDSLTTKIRDRTDRGVFAGLPWFFQYWMRDEAITTKALIEQEHYALAKEVLLRWVHAIHEEQTTAHEASTLRSADGPGLIAKRVNDLLQKLEEDTNNYFSREELMYIKETFDGYKNSLLRDDEGFVINKDKETWMDTAPDGMNRAGIRIEIQCLYLNLLELQITISKLLREDAGVYEQEKQLFVERVKKKFFVEQDLLIDGFFLDNTPDLITRPNIFLAHYLYPDLLTRDEWEQTFDKALDELYLSWGGLSSISQQHSLFQARHTGVNNKSYHQGDSWYFINNIAAITLFKINPHKYYERIHAIYEASKKDLLFLGALGHASEVSSAYAQQSTGCCSQAWSAATLIELLKTMRRE